MAAPVSPAPAARPATPAVAPAFNFGGGLPDPAMFPAAGLAEAATRALKDAGDVLVRYPDPKGWPALREIAAERFARTHGVDVPLDQIVLTNGTMQPIGLAGLSLAGPGATVVVESFAYMGTLNAFRRAGVAMVPAPMDDAGLQTDALAGILDRLAAEGRKPAFIYTIATHQNPTGTTLPLERRQRLLELAERHDTLVVEDDCYADLRYVDAPPPPALYKLGAPGRVLYLGTFSKVLGPGLRLGYIMAPEPLQSQLLRYKIDGGISTFSAMIVAEYCRSHLWQHIAACTAVLRDRRDTLLASLERHLGERGVRWTHPDGGLFVWLRLPDSLDTGRLRELATAAGIAYAAGRAFDAEDRDAPYLRLAFGFIRREDIDRGVAALADCMQRV
jgi:2-aminoadipate transaminase